ncbi:MAG: hypothetical protein IH973_10270 [Myxococcales bacterium]|nr:hypothetical protein [Myxococcales bacterium]
MNRTSESLCARLVAIIAFAAVASMQPAVGSAEVRTLEVVGTVSIDPTRMTSVVPRDAAIAQALREAVVRVAKDFLADQPIDELSDEEIDQELIDRESRDPLGSPYLDDPVNGITGDPEYDPNTPDLDAILGEKMVPYTLRFRVIEDRGRRPALFSDDPDVSEEYLVIVEVQVDVDRIQAKLVEAGLLIPGENALGSNEVRLEIDGLTIYPAYLAMRELLEGPLGATGVYPVEMGHGRTILDVETQASAVEFLEQMLILAPPAIEIVPVQASGNRVHIVVNWVSDPTEASEPGLPRVEH